MSPNAGSTAPGSNGPKSPGPPGCGPGEIGCGPPGCGPGEIGCGPPGPGSNGANGLNKRAGISHPATGELPVTNLTPCTASSLPVPTPNAPAIPAAMLPITDGDTSRPCAINRATASLIAC